MMLPIFQFFNVLDHQNYLKFVLMKSFAMAGHPCNSPSITQVNWYPPICYKIKCNTDGAAKGCPGPTSCGGLFRDRSASILGCFSENLGIKDAFHAELIGLRNVFQNGLPSFRFK